MLNYELLIRAIPTPNPSALKFVVNAPIKKEGKANFTSVEDCKGLTLFEDLFDLGTVNQIHAFENIMTLTFKDQVDPDQEKAKVEAVIRTRMPIHNPEFLLENEAKKKKNYEELDPETKQVEEILDRTIRPGLQADGGNLEVVSYKDNLLTIKFEGACGSCPSSMYGTLDAIVSILQAEFNPKLEITIAPMD